MGFRTLIHAVFAADCGRGVRAHLLRSQAARYALALLVSAFLPIFADSFAARASFVVKVDVGESFGIVGGRNRREGSSIQRRRNRRPGHAFSSRAV